MNGLVKETDELIVSVSNGKLDMRGNPDNFTGCWSEIVKGVNNLSDAFVGPINVTAEYVDRISKGDMPPKITEEYKGDFNEIKNNLNQCITAIELMISDSKDIAHNVSIGKLRFRADGERHQGDYRDIIMGTNSALDGIVGLIDSMPLPVMGIDNEYNVLYMNELGATLDGKRGDELEGAKCFNHFKTSDCNTDNCACNQAMKLNQMASSETDAHPGQHDLEIKYTGVPIKDKEGKVIGAFEVVVDQTEVVQAMEKGKEISEYQKNEADKLTDCLVKMADGNFDFKLEAAEGNEVTKDAAEVFNTIADSVNTCVDVIKGLQNETIGLIDATKNGKLDARGDSSQFNGDWGALLQGVNELCDAFVGPINVTAEYVDRISKGDIPPRIVDDYNGDFNEIKNNLNQCIDVMNGLVKETDELIVSVSNGKLDMRGNPDNFTGSWAQIINGINDLSDAFVGPINVTAEYVDRISKGDIPPKITDEYKGDFNEIKNNLNQCIDAVNALVEDSFNLANAASIGKLRTRADESAHGGSFGQIVGGINRALDSIVGLLDNLPIPVMGIDNEFNILYMNETGAAIDGKTGEALEETKCYNYFKTSHCKTENCACHLAMNRNDQVTSETDAHPAGMDLDIKYTGRPIHDENGNVIGAFEVVLDLTDVKQAMRQAEKEQQMVQIQMEKAKRVSDYQQIETDKIVNTVETLANGDFSADVMLSDPDEETQEAYETLSKILDAVRKFTEAVLTMGEDATILADAAKSGVLETRADTEKHKGDFRKIISGINEILDNILKPVNEASAVLEVMATGDLTTRMTGEYEGDHQKLKDSINSLGGNLGGLITQVSELASTVTEIAVEISSNSETMASGSQEQSAQADEVATAVEEMSRTVTENAMGASKTAEEADRNGRIAKEGGTVVDQTVGKMRDIANVVKLSAENMEKLGKSSQQIGEIISVIDDIADQTNLLALNAAIEAARAGEQGRGFAVVADEVRKLAERTTEATKQIADMIKGIQNETEQAVTAMNQGNEEVNSGIELADKAGNSLQEIVSSSQEVLDMINQIAAASEEQSSTSEQIARNVEAISHVTNDSAKKISEIAHSSDELRRLTNQLSESVAQFKVKDDGSGGYDSYQQDLKPRESHLLAGNGAR
jgi:methyl-accepting chemotaxis protein